MAPGYPRRLKASEKKRAAEARALLLAHAGDVSSDEVSRHVRRRTGTGIARYRVRAIRVELGYPPTWVAQVGKQEQMRLASLVGHGQAKRVRPAPPATVTLDDLAELLGSLADQGVREVHFVRGEGLRVVREESITFDKAGSR